ncbi:hypothetical protein J6590_014689 [Homalodisca vitripennis]|nr:hypothetical protein J6590_014689 [Homalodisca vitripennis]
MKNRIFSDADAGTAKDSTAARAKTSLPQVSTSEGFACDRCGRRYKWRQSLDRHLRHECGKSASYFCQLCSFTAKHKTSLQRHFMTLHMPKLREQQHRLLALQWTEPPP